MAMRGVTFSREAKSATMSANTESNAMTVRILPSILLASAAFFARPASARIGETEAQSQTRYGAPIENALGADEKPLMPGAIERAYLFEGWRIRAAFAGGTTVKIQYVHIENNAPKKLSETETKALLDAEKGKYAWREERSKSAGIAAELEKAIKAGFSLNKWERTDHAKAELVVGVAMQFESRDADTIGKKLAKSPGAAKPAATPTVPKF